MANELIGVRRASCQREPDSERERSQVVSLWHERARRLGLTERERPDFSALSRRELTDLAAQHRALYVHALPVMEVLHQQILNTHSMVILTDQRGLIMHALGDSDFLEKADRVALKPGVSWAEDSKGTNAIGTALTDGRPTLVHGGEHFLTINRFLTCSCCPIRDPHGQVIGSLDVSGPHEGYHPHTMALVRMSTQMIENHLFVDRFGEALRIHFHSRQELLGTLLEGIAAFDEDGRFLAGNPIALGQLGIDPGRAGAHTVQSLFGVDVRGLLGRRDRSLVRLFLANGEAVVARAELRTHRPAAAARPSEPLRVAARPGHGTPERPSLADLDTGDPAIATVIAKVRKAQRHDIPILILGETGTGKELLAHAVHNESARRDRPFVAVDCAALPESLIEAELFGYEEGAFTGARRRGSPGKILLANGGTLFLDEIGDMPLALQTRLLRVLQERAVRPLGGQKALEVDIAVVCATHRDLKEMMRQGEFREDLYYRLNGLVVRLPPLHQRQDLDALIRIILRAQCAPAPELTDDVLELFQTYRWPGNIRQLTNVLRTAAVMADDGGVIGRAQLPDDFLDDLLPAALSPAPLSPSTVNAGGAKLKDLRASAVAAVLRRNAGNVSATARALGVSRNTIYRTLKAANGRDDQMLSGISR